MADVAADQGANEIVQRTLLRAEQEATRIQGERFVASVLLIKALGGGW